MLVVEAVAFFVEIIAEALVTFGGKRKSSKSALRKLKKKKKRDRHLKGNGLR